VEDDVTEIKDEGSEPLGNTFDLDAWEPQLPPSDFAERVVARVRAEERPAVLPDRRRRRVWGLGSVGLGAVALAAAVLLKVNTPPAQGEAIAQDRIEVAIGGRALAVLEPGASVTWKGDDVVQSRGDVFYRVEPGKRFTVHTPAGDVEVKGTCFSVKVRRGREDEAMMKRDVKAGAVGAALSALAFVAVYEGKVAVSHAKGTVELGAGESAQSGPDGPKRASADAANAFEANAAAAAAADSEDPLGAANKNLVRQVSEYRSRLEAIAAQKSELETKLKRSEDRLAASQDGSAPWKHDFDLSTDDWKELAKDGTIKYRAPCFKKEPWTPSASNLNTLGLAPQDGPTLRDAYAHSNQRMWAEVKPLCAKAVGSADVAEKIGVSTCIHLVLDIESARDSEAATVARRQVGEIRAGVRPMPGPNEPMNPVLKLFLTTTGESSKFESELAQAFGPEEAHRIVYSDELCQQTSTFGGSWKR
jgi:hypothetical protein